jgi:hypothetical protein
VESVFPQQSVELLFFMQVAVAATDQGLRLTTTLAVLVVMVVVELVDTLHLAS